jgi:xanthine dehydrogenase accessory factor
MSIFDTLRAALDAERAVALATVVAGPGIGAKLLVDPEGLRLGSLGDPALDEQVREDALGLLDQERNEAREYALGEAQATVLIETYPPPPHLIVVGAVHTAIPLTTAAKLLGFRVTVVDPRTTFATRERFPDADELVTEWPDDALPRLRLDRSTYVAVLTHDPKFDDPAVRVALAHPVRYVGALGSQRTQERRRATLLEAGVPEHDLQRIFGPIGLAIGARTPAELAISILAEIVAVRRGRRERL